MTIALPITQQPNNQLAVRPARELQGIQSYGNWMTERIQHVLAERLRHRNADGTLFVPTVIDAMTCAPWYHIVVVDLERLWHINVDRMLEQATLDMLSFAVRRPVRGFAYQPNGPSPFKAGLVYVVTLKDMPKAEEGSGRIPHLARLDLERADGAGELRVPVGVGANGEIAVPLQRFGHALIVGATGSGKSTWMHSALAALLTANPPGTLRVALVDPKRSEFALWAKSPHLWREIMHDPETATFLLLEIVDEINRRGDEFTRAGVRDIAAYNRRLREPFPYIVVAVDECLDLVLEAGARSEMVRCLKTLAMRGRGAGVFLWAATHHASAVDGLPRVVNVNLLTRLVFRVLDADAARRAGCAGAETISPNLRGRMLAKLDGEPVAVQGFYLPDDELTAIAQKLAGTSAGQGDGLSDFERDLLTWAIAENRGALTIADIARHTGRVGRQARELAESLERRGLARKDRSRRNQRVVSDEGARRAGLGVKLTN